MNQQDTENFKELNDVEKTTSERKQAMVAYFEFDDDDDSSFKLYAYLYILHNSVLRL
jgi:hypothetical protein